MMNALLHDQAKRQLAAVGRSSAGSFVLHGPRSVGKATAARQLARQLNCLGDQTGLCVACRQFEAGNYPDFIFVAPEDKPSITIEQVRQVIQALSLSLYHAGGTRIVIVDEAQRMTVEAQNALLKLIEEPPPQTIFLLLTEQLPALLPTVRSRCAQIYLAPVSADAIAAYLVDHHGATGPDAGKVSLVCEGAVGTAINLLADTGEAGARLELAQTAASVTSLNLFDRLLLAGRLATAKTDLARFGQALHDRILETLRSGEASPQAAAGQLEALERFRLQVQAKVTPKVALERLMVEL